MDTRNLTNDNEEIHLPRRLRRPPILRRPHTPRSSQGNLIPSTSIPAPSLRLQLIAFIWDIFRGGILIACVVGIFFSIIFTPWIQDNLLLPDTPAYLATENIILEYDQFWCEPETDLSFPRGEVIGINWVATGSLDFYVLDTENFQEFQNPDNRLLNKFHSVYEVRGEKNLTTEIQVGVTARYYLIWYYSLANSIENSQDDVDLSFTIKFPPSSKTVISPLVILVTFILITYFVLILVVSLKKYALSPVSKDLEEEELRREENKIQEPQLCPNCFTIVLANETSCHKCGRNRFIDDS
ncbi:MAG: hypothetical protein JSW11_13540 [Candidatus Heimdallarchaeota archaeon]|nr:MAG: hypothetical protein JSW11_13540 [Candidatus Heimdallarchaeota archaeon]